MQFDARNMCCKGSDKLIISYIIHNMLMHIFVFRLMSNIFIFFCVHITAVAQILSSAKVMQLLFSFPLPLLSFISSKNLLEFMHRRKQHTTDIIFMHMNNFFVVYFFSSMLMVSLAHNFLRIIYGFILLTSKFGFFR